jgi:glucose-6-phosphate isomerase
MSKVFIRHEGFDVDYASYEEEVKGNHRALHEGSGRGSDFLGWLELPIHQDKLEVDRIEEVAKRVRENSEVVICIGIGGSYLGLKMGQEFLRKQYSDDTELIFAGHNISSDYLNRLFKHIDGKSYSVIVISKSGTTTEPAIAFRYFQKDLKEKFADYKDRIIAITDPESGALRQLATNEGYSTFSIPRNIGGRYSVLTAVGLLGLSILGHDIRLILKGAAQGYYDLLTDKIDENIAYQYAVARNKLYLKDSLTVELMVSYEPNLLYLNEWWKQLFGESDGKEGLGLFPASASYSTDLHSLGQYVQDGNRIMFESIINVKKANSELVIEEDEANLDGLNYLTGKTVNFVNEKAMEGTKNAHLDGGVPQIIIDIDDFSEETLGYLIYFFEKACAMSGYILGVNPFDQPGVEHYKKNMFELLGKPGY